MALASLSHRLSPHEHELELGYKLYLSGVEAHRAGNCHTNTWGIKGARHVQVRREYTIVALSHVVWRARSQAYAPQQSSMTPLSDGQQLPPAWSAHPAFAEHAPEGAPAILAQALIASTVRIPSPDGTGPRWVPFLNHNSAGTPLTADGTRGLGRERSRGSEAGWRSGQAAHHQGRRP